VKTTDANIVLTEKGDITLKGKKITLEASDSVTIKAKKFEAKTDMATDITAGSQLTLKGSTGGTLDGGAKVDIKGGMVNLN
jgi:phage gp45-like